MIRSRKALALSFSLLSVATAATVAQGPRAVTTLEVPDATVDWIQRSDVSALRPGVIDKLELRIGKEAGAFPNNIIGYLNHKSADAAVNEAKVAADSRGALNKAIKQKQLAGTVVARNQRLLERGPQFVSQEDIQKAEAEFAIADAMVTEAQDNLNLAVAKLDTAKQTLEEHTIRAPFPGVIYEVKKQEGESVNSNEAVVSLGNLDRLRVWAYIPLEFRQRVTEGCDVEIRVRPSEGHAVLNPADQKRFRGKVSFVDPKVQPVSGSEVRIYADVDNPAPHELGPGMKTTMIVTLKAEGATARALPTGSRTQNAPTSVTARPSTDLLPAPR